jgi:hypothetical protein
LTSKDSLFRSIISRFLRRLWLQNGTKIWFLWRIIMDYMVQKVRQITRLNKLKSGLILSKKLSH